MSAGSSRLSVASQFFMDDDGADGQSISDRVVDLLQQTHSLPRDSQKISNLSHVQELIIEKDPSLLDNFLDEVLQFQFDESVEVRNFVLSFAECACKKDNQMLCTVLPRLHMMLTEENQPAAVLKRVILCTSQLYRVTIKWLAGVKVLQEDMEAGWAALMLMKKKIVSELLDDDNDGVRTYAIKFAEMVVITLSAKSSDSVVPKRAEQDITLDQFPDGNSLLHKKKLQHEGTQSLDSLLSILVSASISSINLMVCMGALTSIAKQRPDFMPKVIQAFENLHVNLPPTLSKSQVSSVRKTLKIQLFGLLRHQSSVDLRRNIGTLLTDLGASETEIMRNTPRVSERPKRPRIEADSDQSKRKKQKVLDDDEEDEAADKKKDEPGPSKRVTKATVIDLLADEIEPLLRNHENVANLVLLSMVSLPETMPATFLATYTPIAAAGTDTQVQHLARMVSNQLAAAGIKPSNYENVEVEEEQEPPEKMEEEDFTTKGIPVLGGKSAPPTDESKKKAPIVMEPQPTKGGKRPKHFKLREVTHLLSKDDANKLAHGAVKRIIAAEKAVSHGPAAKTRTKILSALVTQFGGNLSDLLENHILEDLRSRSDIALAWLYQEYSNIQGYMPHTHGQDVTTQRYDSLLCNLLKSLLVRTDQRDGLFNRLVMEAPVITDDALKVIRQFCEDETHFYAGMHALRELILKKPADLEKYVKELLDLTQHERTEVRSQAIQYIKRFYERSDLKPLIEEFATSFLRKLLLNRPPATLVLRLADQEMQATAAKAWTEETAKMCLYLYLALLPINHKLIHELANVYVEATADIKRTVLRVLETPVRGVGMVSPELLLLVETCPKGAETLVTRMMHILTDKTPPSVELVKRVKDLYHKRVSDVRFLIPILTGLEKKDVISAMPKLIRLNPIVVKEVFHRLLMSHQAESSGGQSPLTPAELLVALHNIDPTKCDMKSIIKATSLCFSEKAIYTGEVLAVVMQQLMEQTPLPTLLLRTIIQSLSMYPKLKGFIMNLLLRLINKQVWKTPKLWEGFVKCCERTIPQSFQVLLQLPPPQLTEVFEMSKDMRLKLLSHVQEFSSHQQAHVPKAIMKVLETDPVKEREERERKEAEERKKKEEEERVAREKAEEERLKQEKLKKEKEEILAAVSEQIKKEEAEKREAEERERVASAEAAAAEQAIKSEETVEKTSEDMEQKTSEEMETEEQPEDEGTPTKDEEEEEKAKEADATPIKAGKGRGRGRGAKAAAAPPQPPAAGVRRSSRRK
ncbi:symplekin [Strongylocentrotus purpuratus]|uniref:Symplekin n=1 Tax=Strongylocentrotus purpuratus TaxID=7668 RepID=A0A7M7RE72_STRPU|nr:symplekin [Strongylocentrotus purpuratus]